MIFWYLTVVNGYGKVTDNSVVYILKGIENNLSNDVYHAYHVARYYVTLFTCDLWPWRVWLIVLNIELAITFEVL